MAMHWQNLFNPQDSRAFRPLHPSDPLSQERLREHLSQIDSKTGNSNVGRLEYLSWGKTQKDSHRGS